jgi:hypothetical protein
MLFCLQLKVTAGLAEFLQCTVVPLFTAIDTPSKLREGQTLQDAVLCLAFSQEGQPAITSPTPPGWSLDDRSALANRIATEIHFEAGTRAHGRGPCLECWLFYFSCFQLQLKHHLNHRASFEMFLVKVC